MWCQQVRNQLSAYVDGELSAPRAQAVEVHLSRCEACSREHAGVGGVRSLTAAIPFEDAPASLHAGIMARLADDMAASARSFRPTRRTPSPWALMGLAGAAAAAALVVQHQVQLSQQRSQTEPTVTVRSASAPKPLTTSPNVDIAPSTPVRHQRHERRLVSAMVTDKDWKESILPVERPKPKPEGGRAEPSAAPTVSISPRERLTRPAKPVVTVAKDRTKPAMPLVAADVKPADASRALKVVDVLRSNREL